MKKVLFPFEQNKMEKRGHFFTFAPLKGWLIKNFSVSLHPEFSESIKILRHGCS